MMSGNIPGGGNPTHALTRGRPAAASGKALEDNLDQDRRLVKLFNSRLASGQSAEEIVQEWSDIPAEEVLKQHSA